MVLFALNHGQNDYEELTVDEAKNLIVKLERAITKQERRCDLHL
jgi:hypothetical protein